MTEIRARIRETKRNEMKMFRDFQRGDVLLPCVGSSDQPNGNIGIKVSPSSIRWVHTSLGTSDSVTEGIDLLGFYAVPTSVSFEVVL